MKNYFLLITLLLLGITACYPPAENLIKNHSIQAPKAEMKAGRYNVAFLVMDGVFNSELTAPYDIFPAYYFLEIASRL